MLLGSRVLLATVQQVRNDQSYIFLGKKINWVIVHLYTLKWKNSAWHFKIKSTSVHNSDARCSICQSQMFGKEISTRYTMSSTEYFFRLFKTLKHVSLWREKKTNYTANIKLMKNKVWVKIHVADPRKRSATYFIISPWNCQYISCDWPAEMPHNVFKFI